MILQADDLVVVVHRRLFPGDDQRYFLGKVERYGEGIARVTGHSWLRSMSNDKMFEIPGERTKLFSLASGMVITYVLPAALSLENLVFDMARDGRIVLTNHRGFTMDLTEKDIRRRDEAA